MVQTRGGLGCLSAHLVCGKQCALRQTVYAMANESILFMFEDSAKLVEGSS